MPFLGNTPTQPTHTMTTIVLSQKLVLSCNCISTAFKNDL